MMMEKAKPMDDQSLRERMRSRWDRLTDGDLDRIGESRDRLRQVLQDRYGLSESDVTGQVNHFWTSTISAGFRGAS
jgi:hypothetical protein